MSKGILTQFFYLVSSYLLYSEHKEYEYSYYDDNDHPEAGCEGDDCDYDYYYYDDDDVHEDGHDDYQDYEYYEETGDDSDKENNGDYYYTTME